MEEVLDADVLGEILERSVTGLDALALGSTSSTFMEVERGRRRRGTLWRRLVARYYDLTEVFIE